MAYSNERELDIEDELNNYATKSMRVLAINFLRNVVYASPRKTGRFQSNWVFSVGAPDDSTSESTNESINITRQTGKIASAIIKSSSVLWVSNNLPYAQRLNNGWAKQTPAFFVEKAARISGIDIPDGTL
jgi:hypothetical protein